jgi:hypothetical protein
MVRIMTSQSNSTASTIMMSAVLGQVVLEVGQSGGGSQGFQGSSNNSGGGSQGFQGSSNNSGGGSQGFQGISITGSQGFQGISIIGTQGFQGISIIGTQGFQGSQGFQGISITGRQGFQGLGSLYYGITGTFNYGTGSTSSSLSYSSIFPYMSTPLFPDTTYRVADIVVSATNNEFYTVPVGYKTQILSYTITNVSGASTTTFISAKIASTTYRIDSNPMTVATAATGNRTNGNLFPYVYLAGETMVFTSSQTSNVRATILYVQFNESVPLFSMIKYSGWSVGDNTIYTNSLYNSLWTPNIADGVNGQPIILINQSGASATYNVFNVSSSGTSSGLYRTMTQTLANDAGIAGGALMIMGKDSSFVVNTTSSSNTQVAYMTVLGC